MEVKITNANDIQRFLCILNLGMLDAIKSRKVGFDEAWNSFYRPYVATLVESLPGKTELVDLFWDVCLLENLNDWHPEKLDEYIEPMRDETLRIMDMLEPKLSGPYWLDENI